MSQSKKKKHSISILDWIERIGNKLPDPVVLFMIFALAIIAVSHFAAGAGLSATYESINPKTQELGMVTVQAVSLMTPEGLQYMVESAVTNFTSFAPLGTVLVALLGVGIAESSGLISVLLRRAVLVAPKPLLSAMVVFLGIMANIASDAGYVVLIPLGAIIFLSFGRHPLAGIAAAFAGVSGGFSANLLLSPTDPLLAGISQQAANMIDPTYQVSVAGNWFFLIVSTFIITIIGAIITDKIVEPRLGKYKGANSGNDKIEITPIERKGLRWAGVAFFIFLAVVVYLGWPGNALNPFTEANPTADFLKSSLMSGIVLLIALLFAVPGLFYGIATKTFKTDKDVVRAMAKSMSTMGGYLVLVFFAAQFIAYFNYTNLGTLLAVNGATILENIGMTGPSLMIGFIIVAAIINIFIGSASAKWAIMAPIFVPMFMALAITPEATQMAFRIGDSVTNIISPLMSYFAIVIAFSQKYDVDGQPSTGIGTLISMMLPYSISFLIFWSITFFIWFTFNLPLGPGVFPTF
ncbi:MAG: AbgT family transporter [Culicoidibacterales bacterium]